MTIMIRNLMLTMAGVLALLPAAARQGTSAGTPEIVFEETSCDFGEVSRRGDDPVHVFRFRNEGTAPAVITRVVTTCTCVKVHHPRRPVEAGGEGEIRVTYEARKGEPGSFHRVVQIYTNAPDGRHTLVVQGTASDRRERRSEIKNR